ncbi:uncharacterized protein LTHEOB_10983 [Lasiodiplodia theobromae]|uniref:uncharacterized protein n=1 Tax=Lasiodiplodia theobromae TaxID=45133 RepID=UPI0015C325B4|nr:uncharacterized protein LTHEOB_10983 [Lasiodiplodia theobromae]KAF4538213.1 hypothetical protein LTHEOB_10983 [Lasiodiplodia theobromae]
MSLTQPASPDLGQIFPASCPCANTSDATGQPCGKAGVKTCSNCFLVSYCSNKCQKRHLKKHKIDCKAELIKPTWDPLLGKEEYEPNSIPIDEPIWTQTAKLDANGKPLIKYLWGNMPAFDVLKLDRNEGANYDRDINLLFAASGDIRNVIKTITGVSSSQQQAITAVINDREIDIVARNAIMLLAALYVKPTPVAAAAILHIWYSVIIPSSVLQTLRTTVLPLIQDVCAKVAEKPADQLLAKTFTQGPCRLRLVLEKRNWVALTGYLDIPYGLTKESCERTWRNSVLANAQRYDWHMRMFDQIPGWRGSTKRFRLEGVLMPFGASRSMFDMPNPTFFQHSNVWPMMPHLDPFGGWSLDDILQSTPMAKHDIHGGVFFLVRDVLIDFCTKVQTMKVSFVLLHTEAANLPNTLAKDYHMTHSFDRIEVSNATDEQYLGLDCLRIFTPLLRPLNENPYATLMTLFLNSIRIAIGQNPAEDFACMMREAPRAERYLLPQRQLQNSPSYQAKLYGAWKLFRDFDGLFESYRKLLCFNDVAKKAGLREKPKHTIVEPRPMRLSKDATQAEFDKCYGSYLLGSERYVEWQRLA